MSMSEEREEEREHNHDECPVCEERIQRLTRRVHSLLNYTLPEGYRIGDDLKVYRK